MDCMTISTFRSLEQQAIRQSREDLKRDQIHKVATRLMETFRQEPIVKPENTTEAKKSVSTTNGNKVNYFA